MLVQIKRSNKLHSIKALISCQDAVSTCLAVSRCFLYELYGTSSVDNASDTNDVSGGNGWHLNFHEIKFVIVDTWKKIAITLKKDVFKLVLLLKLMCVVYGM